MSSSGPPPPGSRAAAIIAAALGIADPKASAKPKQERRVGRDPNSPSKKRISALTDIGVGDPSYWELRYSTECAKMMKFDLFDW
jgi:hypothetical protein